MERTGSRGKKTEMGGLPIFFCCVGKCVGKFMADLVGLVEQAVTGLGYELVDVEISPRARLLRIFIDRLPPTGVSPEAGATSAVSRLTVEDCSTVSHHLTRLLMVENIDYDRLEVSSPGLDRTLKKLADFERFVGHEIQMRLRIPEGTQRNFSGVIAGVDAGRLRLRSDEVEREFALENIEKARLVPKF